MDCFALVDQARSGVDNMGTDHQMLVCAAQRQLALLRIYQWSTPTVSLGYFQSHRDRLKHTESSTLDLVRRSTGGGAIVHHHDLTYSVAVPDNIPSLAGNSPLGASQPLYDHVHDRVVEFLRGLGLTAQKWPEATCRNQDCSYLCFERRSFGDIIIGDSKVMGSAQRRYRGALLQHGSLLLSKSEFAPSLCGLADLSDQDPAVDKLSFAQAIQQAVAEAAQVNLQVIDSFSQLLEGLPEGTYGQAEWTLKR